MWIERALAQIAPGWAARRMADRLAWERISAHYEGAGQGRRLRGWRAGRTGPNAEVQPALPTLRARSRDLVRNNAWAAAGLDIAISYEVGYGITPRSRTGDAELDERVNAAFTAWAGRCDAAGRTDFYGMQALLARSRAEAGEGLALMLPLSMGEARRRALQVPLLLQALEPDHIDDTAETLARGRGDRLVRQGIELDDRGAPVAYHLKQEHPGERLTLRVGAGSTVVVPASRVIHIYRQDRAGQFRGVPDLSPIIARLLHLSALEDAALEQAKVQACLAAFVTSSQAAGRGPLEGEAENGDPPLKSFSPGMIERLLPGEDVKFSQPSGAGAFSDLARHQLHAIASAWGLTYDLLTGDLSQANYSSLRAGRLAFKRRLEQRQWHLLIPGMCQRVWDAWAAQAVMAGVLPDRPGGYPVEWSPPPFEMVDPLKDALALRLMRRMGLTTWKRQVSEQGFDPAAQARELAEENALFDDLGLILDVDPRRTAGTGSAQDATQNAAVEIAATGAASPAAE